MNRALVAMGIVLLLAGPALAQQATPKAPPVDFPEDVEALARGWVADVEARVAPHADKPWFAEMDGFLQKAKREAEEGRVRAAMFDLETTDELLRANLLLDETAGRNDADRKALVIERTQAWRAEGDAAWEEFRARLKSIEGDIGSLHTLELALYAADLAIGAKLNLDNHKALVPEYRKVNFSREATLDLVRASATPVLDLAFADDVLDAALEREGLPPALNATRWNNRYAIPETRREPDETGQVRLWEAFAPEVRANDERTMSVAIGLAEQRELRRQQIALTYGDAASRGQDSVNDAAKFMERRMNRSSYDDLRPHGLLGIFTADAVDQARFVLSFHEQGKAQMGFLTSTWANLDYQEFVAVTLADVSPVRPDTPTNLGYQNDLARYMQNTTAENDKKSNTPGAGATLVLAGVAAALAIASRRR